jgi:hypothetical protein
MPPQTGFAAGALPHLTDIENELLRLPAFTLRNFNSIAISGISPIDNEPPDCHQSLTVASVNQV